MGKEEDGDREDSDDNQDTIYPQEIQRKAIVFFLSFFCVGSTRRAKIVASLLWLSFVCSGKAEAGLI